MDSTGAMRNGWGLITFSFSFSRRQQPAVHFLPLRLGRFSPAHVGKVGHYLLGGGDLLGGAFR